MNDILEIIPFRLSKRKKDRCFSNISPIPFPSREAYFIKVRSGNLLILNHI